MLNLKTRLFTRRLGHVRGEDSKRRADLCAGRIIGDASLSDALGMAVS